MSAQTDFHVTVFEAIPSPIFVIDREFSIIDFNSAAGKLPNAVVFNALRARGGDMLGCVHAEGGVCGEAAACRGCSIQKVIRDAFTGGYVCRRAIAMPLRMAGGGVEITDFLVTAAPFRDGKEPLLLLILENLGEIIRAATRGDARGTAAATGK